MVDDGSLTDDDELSLSPNELKQLRTLYDSDDEDRRKIERDLPELAEYLKALPSDLDIEIDLMPEKIVTLEKKLVAAEGEGNRILCCEIANEILTDLDKEQFPALCGMTYLKLGTTLAMLSGKDTENLRGSITALTDAIAYLPPEEFYMLVLAYYNLAISYADERLFDWENADENWGHCISYGEKALSLIEEHNPEHGLKTEAILLNLGIGYHRIGTGVKEDNLEKAICYFERLLDFLDERNDEDAVHKKAVAIQGLCKIYLSRERGDPEKNRALAEDYANKFKDYV